MRYFKFLLVLAFVAFSNLAFVDYTWASICKDYNAEIKSLLKSPQLLSLKETGMTEQELVERITKLDCNEIKEISHNQASFAVARGDNPWNILGWIILIGIGVGVLAWIAKENEKSNSR